MKTKLDYINEYMQLLKEQYPKTDYTQSCLPHYHFSYEHKIRLELNKLLKSNLISKIKSLKKGLLKWKI